MGKIKQKVMEQTMSDMMREHARKKVEQPCGCGYIVWGYGTQRFYCDEHSPYKNVRQPVTYGVE